MGRRWFAFGVMWRVEDEVALAVVVPGSENPDPGRPFSCGCGREAGPSLCSG